ncbi:MAG TPA: hypothetical protein VLI06_15135 [Solimonas sp.]|nr:hypothetical protein [Solimonas sp.]
MRKSILIILPLLAALGLFALARPDGGSGPGDTVSGTPPPATTTTAAAASTAAGAAAASSIVLGPEDAAFLQNLRDKFGPAMRGRHGQIRAIEQVIAYLMERYPADWRERAHAFLQSLSPELAQQLIAGFDSLLRYQDWLRDNRERLKLLPAPQRRAELWQLRQELFGKAAAEEIWAAERRSEQMQDSLAALDVVDGRRIEEKLDSYLSTIDSAYGAGSDRLVERRGTELMNRFLDLKSVQSQLTAMPPGERSTALRGIRQRMGMDESALARWDSLDQERDRQWDAGKSYQQEREQIVAQYRGTEQAEQLRKLQEQNFGAEAEIIRSEEASGFYRYAQGRRIGRE